MTRSKITLTEKKEVQNKDKEKVMIEKVISNDYGISETFNTFFANKVPNLKIIPSGNFVTIQYETGNLVLNKINKFKNHPSIMATSKINLNKTFSCDILKT